MVRCLRLLYHFPGIWCSVGCSILLHRPSSTVLVFFSLDHRHRVDVTKSRDLISLASFPSRWHFSSTHGLYLGSSNSGDALLGHFSNYGRISFQIRSSFEFERMRLTYCVTYIMWGLSNYPVIFHQSDWSFSPDLRKIAFLVPGTMTEFFRSHVLAHFDIFFVVSRSSSQRHDFKFLRDSPWLTMQSLSLCIALSLPYQAIQ